MFLKAPFSFLINILNWKDCQVDPTRFAPLFPSGDKQLVDIKTAIQLVGNEQLKKALYQTNKTLHFVKIIDLAFVISP